MKRGQSNIWWIIVAAILVLVVAGVLIYVFSSKISGFKSETESCSYQGGVCKVECEINEQELKNTDCSGAEPVCCLSIFK